MPQHQLSSAPWDKTVPFTRALQSSEIRPVFSIFLICYWDGSFSRQLIILRILMDNPGGNRRVSSSSCAGSSSQRGLNPDLAATFHCGFPCWPQEPSIRGIISPVFVPHTPLHFPFDGPNSSSSLSPQRCCPNSESFLWLFYEASQFFRLLFDLQTPEPLSQRGSGSRGWMELGAPYTRSLQGRIGF